MARKSQELKAHRDEKIKLAEGILESSGPDKPLTDDQRKLLDSITADIKILNTDIDHAEFIEDAAANRDTQSRKTQMLPQLREPEDKQRVVITSQMRPSRLVAFRGPDAEQSAYKAGMWAMAALWNNGKAKQFCKDHGIPLIMNAAVEGDDAKGGFLVPDVMERAIIDLREVYGLARRSVRIRPMSSDFQTIPRRAGGLTAYALGEGSDFTLSDKSWSAVNLTARKWGVLAKYSSEVAEDAIISIGDDLANEIAYAFAYAEDYALFLGDGTSTYHGITGLIPKFENALAASVAYAGAPDAASGHDTPAEYDISDMMSLVGLCPTYALPRAAWYCSPTFAAMVLGRLSLAAGGAPKSDVAGSLAQTFLGFPIYTTVLMSKVLTDDSNHVAFLFGDMSQAVSMGTRRGVTIAVSTDRYFESDMIGIRGIERFDINVHDIGTTAVVGPLLALMAE